VAPIHNVGAPCHGRGVTSPRAPSTLRTTPGRNARLPAVDERLVAPESHAEIVDGVVYETMGANPPHARQHTEVTHVFRGCLAAGYEASVDMLTRADKKTDAAPDVSVYPSGTDPDTGGRLLEEIAFEVVDTESVEHVTKKTRKLAKRGVRRLFYVHVSHRAVFEWAHAEGEWKKLDDAAEIVDRCFSVPIPVRALVDRVLADDTVARALLAGGNRVLDAALRQQRAQGLQDGRAQGRRDALRMLAKVAGITLSADDEARIDACGDVETLDRWIANGRSATTAAELLP
jgi:Putative restriction endonuclease